MAGGSTIKTKIQIGGEIDSSLKSAFSQIDSYAEKLSPAFSKMSQIAGGAALGIGAAVGLGASSFAEYDEALRQLQAKTGGLGEDLSDIMQQVYADNFGESWEDVADSISSVNTLIGGTKEEVAAATENAIAFRDTFGYEVNESTRAASTMMKQFGISSDEAFNIMAQGEQQGLDYSDELIDSINEYSVQFAKFGFSAEDMFTIFSNGAKNGAFNLDKVGDAVKEFSIRAIDGSNTTIDGFTQLGMNADEMAAKFGAGGDTARDAFAQVVNAIKQVDDPVKQSIIGVDLFGTMWEDLGPQVVTQLADMNSEFDKTRDTMGEINEIKYTSFMSGLTGIKRQIEAALIPLGESLVPVMNDFANWFQNVGTPKIKEFANWIGSVLPGAIEVVKGVFIGLGPVFNMVISSLPVIISLMSGFAGAFASLKIASTIGKIISVGTKAFGIIRKLTFAFQAVAGGAATLSEGLLLITTPVGWIALAIGSVIAVVTALYIKCEGFRNFINTAISSIIGWIQGSLMPAIQGIANSIGNLWNGSILPFLNWIVSTFGPLFAFAFSAIQNVVSSVFTTIGNVITNGLQVFQGIIDFITGVFTANWSMAWQGVVSVFSGIFNGIVEIARGPIDAITGLVNGVISKINSIGSIKLPGILGGGTIGIDIPEVPQFAEGGFTSQTSICGEDGPEAVIPLKRNNPRSLALLEKTAGAIGANNTSSVGNNFIFAPQISGNVDSSSIKMLEQSFEDFKQMVLESLKDEGRIDYA